VDRPIQEPQRKIRNALEARQKRILSIRVSGNFNHLYTVLDATRVGNDWVLRLRNPYAADRIEGGGIALTDYNEAGNDGVAGCGLGAGLHVEHRIVLGSPLPDGEVRTSYAVPATLADAISGAEELLVVPAASKLILDVLDR